MKDALGYYQTLQVSPQSSAEEIKSSYHKLAKIWHPDYNKDVQSTDIFQKISVAYETLGDDKKRKIYDLLSIAYTEENYPDIENMSIIGSDIDVASVKVTKVMSWIINYKTNTDIDSLTYSEALKKHSITAIINWFFGWWHPKGAVDNIKAIISNFKYPVLRGKTSQINIHNMVCSYIAQNNVLAAKYGLSAKPNLSAEDAELVSNFINSLGVRIKPIQAWNITMLKLVQLIVPLFVVLLIFISVAKHYVETSDSGLWSMFFQNREINYYQQVNYGGGKQSVDDMVVGKVISIPVNKSDSSKLYHLKSASKIMYGPSDDFDIIKTLDAKTTVRLTGITPDNVWARVMIDNGETGFVHMNNITKGIGSPIPYGSSITD